MASRRQESHRGARRTRKEETSFERDSSRLDRASASTSGIKSRIGNIELNQARRTTPLSGSSSSRSARQSSERRSQRTRSSEERNAANSRSNRQAKAGVRQKEGRKNGSRTNTAAQNRQRNKPKLSRELSSSKKRRTNNKPREIRRKTQRRISLASILLRSLAVLAILSVLGVIAFFAARNSSLFKIEQIEAAATEHVSQEDIAKLISLSDGATLLNYDEESIQASIKKNPWVQSVSVTKNFPHSLSISIEERKVAALVLMSRGSIAWYLGSDDVWIEPVSIVAGEERSSREEALTLARARNALLVTDIPATVEPMTGEKAVDAEILAISNYARSFSEDFRNTITSFSASSVESIACTLDSGIEVSLGEPEQIELKEAEITELIQRFPTGLTYINVRSPQNPSYRRIETEHIQNPQEGSTNNTTATG